MDIDTFRTNLDATLRWCVPRFTMENLNQTLRSPELAPEHNIVHDIHALDLIRDVVNDVVDRRNSLAAHDDHPITRRLPFAQGRLLAFFPNQSLFHGASVPETGGFIDENEIPAWDTWIYFVEDFLISWVPFHLLNAVDSAILVNPEESIKWALDVDHRFIAALTTNGLIA